jgi:adenosylcobinamide kinase/adenosylcobinamide-phosphate guanylyltransferase
VTDRTDVVAVHLGHGNPPGPELGRRLAAWGARVVPDGTVLHAGAAATTPRPSLPRRTLLLGGARSGKSVEAERRLAAEPAVVYVATGGTRPGDAEWAERVEEHRARRPDTWRTVETTDLEPLLGETGPPLLVDCLALWLAAVMDDLGAWDDARWRTGAAAALAERTERLVEAVHGARRRVVLVSNEVGSGVVPTTGTGRRYRDELGRLNARVAARCEEVLLLVAGRAVPLPPAPADASAQPAERAAPAERAEASR